MILADKIIDLRKKNGWSQEELAEKLDVSRQSISKWEGAQSVPDMSRIIKLSEVFDVSTDYLLKDEIESEQASEYREYADGSASSYEEVPLRPVSMEEANDFLYTKALASRKISLGVLLCILSPSVLIALGTLQDTGILSVSAGQAAGLGLVAMFALVGIAVALFVTTGLSESKYEYIEKELLDTAYGVDGAVRDKKEKFHPIFTKSLTAGIVLCVISVIPLFISMIMFRENANDPSLEIAAGLSVSALLIIVAVGVMLIVRVSVVWGGFQMLLEEGDYSREKKILNKRTDPIASVYWIAVTIGYLAWSFISMEWHRTWIIWPIAGVGFALIMAIAGAVKKK